MDEMKWDDPHKAYRALRVVLHALRDHLTLEETAHLGAQFPMLIRGLYYEGWKPSKQPIKERHEEQFLARIAEYFQNDPELRSVAAFEVMTSKVFSVIARHISKGEMKDVLQILPTEIRNLWL
jgi:uncharacterized protein (DUF2267 family)